MVKSYSVCCVTTLKDAFKILKFSVLFLKLFMNLKLRDNNSQRAVPTLSELNMKMQTVDSPKMSVPV
jgi:hypothetical protein